MADKTYLKRDAILNANDIITEEVFVPEWGGTIVVKMLNGNERDKYMTFLLKIRGAINADDAAGTVKLVQMSVIDPETKKLLFSEGDIDALSKKSSAALQRVSLVAIRLNALSAVDIDTMSKNSKATQKDAFITN